MSAPAEAYLTKDGKFLTKDVMDVGTTYRSYIAKFLKGTVADGGYSESSSNMRERIKELFHLDILIDAKDVLNAPVHGFIGGVISGFISTDGLSPAISQYQSPNCKYHNLSKRKGAMELKVKGVSITDSNFGTPSTRVGTVTYTLFNDAGLNTLGDLGGITINYFFGNAYSIRVNAKAPFYDNAEAHVSLFVPTTAYPNGQEITDSEATTVLMRESRDIDKAGIMDPIGYTEQPNNNSRIVVTLVSGEGSIPIERFYPALREIKRLRLIKCESASQNPEVPYKAAGYQAINVVIFNKHYNMLVFPTSNYAETNNLFGTSGTPTGYQTGAFRPVPADDEGLVALYNANGLTTEGTTQIITETYPANGMSVAGYYADVDNHDQGYYIDNLYNFGITKLYKPVWANIKPVITLNAFWSQGTTEFNTAIKIQASVSADVAAGMSQSIVISGGVLRLLNSSNGLLATYNFGTLTITAGAMKSNIISASVGVAYSNVAKAGWAVAASAVTPSGTFEISGNPDKTPVGLIPIG